MKNMAVLFGGLEIRRIFAVLIVQYALILRGAAVIAHLIVELFLCSIFKNIRRLSMRSHYFALRGIVYRTVSSVYGNRFPVACNDLNAYSHE